MASVRNVAAVGLIVFLISAWPALAEEYPFDVAKKYPASMRAWQTLVPSEAKQSGGGNGDERGQNQREVDFHNVSSLAERSSIEKDERRRVPPRSH